MQKELLTRRAFFNSVTSTASKSFLVLSMPAILAACREAQQARLSGADFQTLTEEEANEFDAIAARILPTTSTPGAREAGVIFFLDNVLGGDREEEYALLKTGLRELQSAVAVEFEISYFFMLDENQQDQMLRKIEATEFFQTLRYLTVAGMFSLPEYGGNKDFAGFQVMEFEDRHAWVAPYGYYDADYAEKGE